MGKLWQNTKPTVILLILSSLTFAIYYLTSGGHTPYDYFIRLTNSFLDGKYYLADNPPWLSELITIGPKMFTFVNPPMPAFIGLPFVYFFKDLFYQEYLAQLIGALSVIVVGHISLKIKNDKQDY